TEKEKLLQIVLVGQPQLKDKLNSPDLVQLRQRISIRFHIKALGNNEVPEYIEHRLKIAGAPDKIVFPPDAISLIYSYSRGIPRLINVLCDKSLLLGYVQESYFIGQNIVQKSIDELEGQFSFVET
ncbi:MAG: ATPase, partial [Candidatus Omnitrophota bacterium]